MDFKELEKEYFTEKEVYEIGEYVKKHACPICGGQLDYYIGGAQGDCLEFKAHIYCTNCHMFNADSDTHSNYDQGNYRAQALRDVWCKVKPYCKLRDMLKYN